MDGMIVLGLAVIVACIVGAWIARSIGCLITLGLALIAVSFFIAWWANYSMQSNDMEAPFVVGTMGLCLGLPLSGMCFVIAASLSRGAKKSFVESKRWDPDAPKGVLERFLRR